MKTATCWTATMLIAALLLSAACTQAQDWSQWRGPNRDGKVVGFTVPLPWPAALTQV